jgi:DNA (cytosine-5)-methyltransferase 1
VDAWALVEAFLVNFNGNGTAHAAGEPIKTVTGNDRFGLVMLVLDSDGVAGIPVLLADGAPGLLDIRFRMLQPHELAGAMSFPKTYVFTGTRKDRVRQIGNAVPRRTAGALCHTILS